MKTSTLRILPFALTLLLAACSQNPDLKKAEQLVKEFNCSVTHIASDANIIDQYNFNAMQSDKEKVEFWLSNYKKGMNDFNQPLSEIITRQLEVFTSSCESLGGHLVK